MEEFPVLHGRPGRTNRRGAVFLLSVYFASLMLLVLGGISLQRTMIETRASQLSRDSTQAFYLADGALDYALSAVKKEYVLGQISIWDIDFEPYQEFWCAVSADSLSEIIIYQQLSSETITLRSATE